MDADPKLNAAARLKPSRALDHAALHLDGALHGVHHATELDNTPVAGALNDAAAVSGEGGVDEVAASTRSRASVRSSFAPASRE